MDILFNIRKDLAVKSLLLNTKTNKDLKLLLSNRETYSLVVEGLSRIMENDRNFIYCIASKAKTLLDIVNETYEKENYSSISEKEEDLIGYLNYLLDEDETQYNTNKKGYEYSCIEIICSYREQNSYKNFIELVKKEFDILVSQYYTDDLMNRVYLERSPSFLVMANELIRAYGTSLPKELLIYMEAIIKGGYKDRLLDHMYTKKFTILQGKTLKNIRSLYTDIEQNKCLSKKQHI